MAAAYLKGDHTPRTFIGRIWGLALDKSEGGVKDKDLLSVF
jgi:hypothetical protein